MTPGPRYAWACWLGEIGEGCMTEAIVKWGVWAGYSGSEGWLAVCNLSTNPTSSRNYNLYKVYPVQHDNPKWHLVPMVIL